MDSITQVIEQLHPLERKIVPLLSHQCSFEQLVSDSKLKEVEVMRALQWLQNKQVIELSEKIMERVVLDQNGFMYVKKGLPERRFLKALTQADEEYLEDIEKKAELDKNETTICLGLLKQQGAIEIKKEKGLKIKLLAKGKELLEQESDAEKLLQTLPQELKLFKKSELATLELLKKRRAIVKVEQIKSILIYLTPLGEKIVKIPIDEQNVIDSVTPQMLKDGSWKQKKFRRYDVVSKVPETCGGKRHFVNQATEYAKQIWLDLGFKEMKGHMLHTSFWDLDVLFVPQDHPARAMQDTFYTKDPKKGRLPTELAKKIKNLHEHGGDTGSLGWQMPWSQEKAKELLLRTHTTVLSAQMLATLKKEQLPAKYFAIGKVFRNERVDWKHLFEFDQVDGIVIDPNANFQNLLGYLKEFFGKMGFKDARIRPAHFPYTEPSAEIDVLHPIRNEWIELGGCGIFRPEVTKTLLGEEIPVLAWGFGLGRIICPYYGITDLRDLNKNDLKSLREMKIWMRE